jgi:hypothetical protein
MRNIDIQEQMEEVVSQEELTEQENKIQGLNERNKRENE